jgi:HlyD family secretion protein/hemolysin D
MSVKLGALNRSLTPEPIADPSPSADRKVPSQPVPRRRWSDRAHSLIPVDLYGRSATEIAFLPAALEVVETPPNPLGRRMTYAICLVVFAALAWAIVGKVDIVAVASGKIVSHLHTQVVQPFETASVQAVLVVPGQQVQAGDPLIELDKTAAIAERSHAERDLAAASLDRMRLSAFLDGQIIPPFDTIAAAMPLEIAHAEAQLAAQFVGRRSQIGGLQQEKLQHIAERESLKQTATKIEETLPFVQQRAEIRTKANAFGASSIPTMLESQQLLVETRAELKITRSKIAALDAQIDGLDQKIASTDAEIRMSAMGDLNKAQDRASTAEEAKAKAIRRVELQTLKAPVSGTVQQIHIAGLGTVVTPAQQLLSIVPTDDKMEVEAILENRDVGFIAVGQRVELKVDAFPFTRYGLLRGTVISVDRDAEAAPVNPAGVQGSERKADETDRVEGSERLRYTVHIAFQPGTLDVDGRPALLLPGMSVKAEILTGKRRIIDFILAPLREHTHDAFRER